MLTMSTVEGLAVGVDSKVRELVALRGSSARESHAIFSKQPQNSTSTKADSVCLVLIICQTETT